MRLLVIEDDKDINRQIVAALEERRAGAEDFDETESFFLERLGHGALELLDVEGGPAGDEAGAGGVDELRDVQLGFEAAVRREIGRAHV